MMVAGININESKAMAKKHFFIIVLLVIASLLTGSLQSRFRRAEWEFDSPVGNGLLPTTAEA